MPEVKSPVGVFLDSTKRRLCCYPYTETERGKQQGKRKGEAGGVKRERQRCTGKKTSVDSDRKKTEAAHVPATRPPYHPPEPYPTPLQTSICGLTT